MLVIHPAHALEVIMFVKICVLSTTNRTLLIPLERREGLGNTLARDDHHLQPVTNLDMPLDGAREGIPHQILNVVLW
jgi:hypothetical protein